MNRFALEGTVRASFAVYNTLDEVNILAESLIRLCKLR
jgi:cysteine desulfurase/selenocysteine lyase